MFGLSMILYDTVLSSKERLTFLFNFLLRRYKCSYQNVSTLFRKLLSKNILNERYLYLRTQSKIQIHTYESFRKLCNVAWGRGSIYYPSPIFAPTRRKGHHNALWSNVDKVGLDTPCLIVKPHIIILQTKFDPR